MFSLPPPRSGTPPPRGLLRAHPDRAASHKLRISGPLKPGEFTELESLMTKSGAAAKIEPARAAFHGLSRSIRSLVGLDATAMAG